MLWLISRGGQIVFLSIGLGALTYAIRGLIREGGL